VGTEGQRLRQAVRGKDTHVLGVVAGAQLPARRTGAVEDDQPGRARPLWEGIDAEQLQQLHLQPGLLTAFAHRGLFDALVGLDVAGRQSPPASEGFLAPPDQHQAVL